MLSKVLRFSIRRAFARVLAVTALVTFNAPPAAALVKSPSRPQRPTQKLAPLQAQQERHKEFARRVIADLDEVGLTRTEMAAAWGRGPYRNRAFNGVLPWQRSLRDVNLCNGNLFKSFTDIQVSPARGAGLAWQRTYNSNDEREGPFGIGWTHAYDIRMEEAGANIATRTDFFGGKHNYTRDADGLYSPPPYMFDELSSGYENFLVDGPAVVLSDDQKGMDGTTKHFIANGNERTCSSITDRHGNTSTLTYGLNVTIGGVNKNLLTRVTDPSGRYLDVSWANLGTMQDPHYRITQVAGPIDPGTQQPVYTVAYTYNEELNLSQVRQDPNGLNRITSYSYATVESESGLLAGITDPLGHSVSYVYTRFNQAMQPHYTGTLWVTTIYEPGSGGYPHTWTINDSTTSGSVPFAVTAGSNGGLGFGMAVDTSLRFRWYGLGNSPYLHYVQYDSANNVVQTVQAQWAPQMSQRSFYEALPTVTANMTYGPHGNVLTQSVQGYSGTTTTSYYNGSKYFQKESVTDPMGNVTSFDYYDNQDTIGRKGEVKWVRDARYGVTGEQFEYDYNQYGQKSTETNLNDVVTTYAYGDTWGNLTQVIQDPGMGGLNRTTSMVYDVAGRVLSSTDPKSQTSTFAYNGAGQPTAATLPGETITYTYGGNGRTQSVQDGRGTTTLAYETGNDRVSSVTDPVTGTMSFTYGMAGERLTVALPGGGTWNYTYETAWEVLPKDDPNSVGKMLWKVTDDQGRIVEVTMGNLGALREVRSNQTGTGMGLTAYQTARYTFDDGASNGRMSLTRIKNTYHWLNTLTMQWEQKTLVQNDYTYSAKGNRLSNAITDEQGPVRTEAYGYDPLSRLTSVDYGDGQTQTYTFDPMGNRLTKTDSVAGNDSYTYNDANMLLTRNGNGYTNDANGNTLTGGGRTNTWDGQNRLATCAYANNTSSHVYGTDGLRRQSTVNSAVTDFILDGQSVVRSQVQGEGGVQKTWFHGVRGPEYERTGSGDAVWYIHDGLGSITGTVGQNGNLVSTRKYDVYGAVRGSTGPSGPKHKYVGSLGHPSEDETGLIYMRARYADPVTGAFVSEDPDRQGGNWFSYCGGSPTQNADITGTVFATFRSAAWTLGALCCWAALDCAFNQFGRSVAALRWLGLAISAFAVALGSTSDVNTALAWVTGAVFGGTGAYTALIDYVKGMANLSERHSCTKILVRGAFAYGMLCLTAMILNDLDTNNSPTFADYAVK